MRSAGLVLGLAALLLATADMAVAQGPARPEAGLRAKLERMLDTTVTDWRFRLGENTGAEEPDFDDSSWESVKVGHQWMPHDSTCWYRTRITIPERIHGQPVAGSTIRMQAGMDNEAKAYVDGRFVQQFMWAKGDFVIAENAVPGQVVTVALYGINRPGYGSLYQAYLACDASTTQAESLRTLLKDYERVDSFIIYGPAEDTRHWRELLKASLACIDVKSFSETGDAARDQFLASIDDARETLASDAHGLDKRLRLLEMRLKELNLRLSAAETAHGELPYERLDARVVESYIQYVQDDVEDGIFSHRLRGLWTMPYLERLCADATIRVQSITDDPAGTIQLPRYHTAPFGIENGAFVQDGRPLFFTGVGHFGQVRKDVPILKQFGLNIIQIEIGPNSVLTEPGVVTDDRIRRDTLATLDNAAAHDITVNLLISPHYFPKWVLDAHPELAECGFGFLKNCIDAPESLEVYETFLRTLMPLIAGHPALHSICLSNEPQYQGRCAHALAGYKTWLKEYYGTVEALNQAQSKTFTSFDDVTLPENAQDYAAWSDYCRYNHDCFLGFHEFLRDLIHEYAPELPVHAKIMSHAFEDPGKYEVGIDAERFSQLGSISGNDCVQNFDTPDGPERIQNWLTMAMNYTLQRSAAPGNPVFNSEDHIIPDGYARFVPGAHIRTVYWTQALYGQGAATTWVWERQQEGDFSENILTRAHCVRELGRVALDLNRFAPEMAALQNRKADVAILYAFSSLLPSQDFTKEATAAFEGLSFAGVACDFVTERQAAAGALGRYKLVIAPQTSHIPDAVIEALRHYVENSGVLVTTGECFTHDERGNPRVDHRTWQDRRISIPIRLQARGYQSILNDLVDEAGCDRPIRLEGVHGEPVWGVLLRHAVYEGRRVATLVNFSREPIRIVLTRQNSSKPVAATNLFYGTKARFPMKMPPLEPVLLALEE